MKHIRGLISTAQVLRHVFVTPLHVPRFQLPRHVLAPTPTLTQSRLYRASPRSLAQPESAESHARDEAIEARVIQVVNEQGALDPPAMLNDVLKSMDRKEHFLMQVSPTLYNRPTICKIVNRVEHREHERAKAKAAHAAKVSTKQVELNWAINAHDLEHRLKQLRTFLNKGRKVEVVLTRKKGKRAPNVEEIKHLMESVIGAIKEERALQVKPMEGEPGKHVVFVVKKNEAMG